jgi:hypothetical protein
MARHKEPEIQTSEVSDESQYRPLSEPDLKELALAVLNGNVFGSWMLPEHDVNLLPSIFMVMVFLDDIKRKEMKRDGVVHVYEFMDKAGPRSINGYPIFMSARFLNADDAKRLQAKITQVKEALDAI